MARPRAAQFGKDIGVSTAEAKRLINEGRRRKDGGSTTLESNMNKMRGYDVGGSVAKGGKKKSVKNIKDVDEMERIVTEDTEIGTKRERKFKDTSPDLNVPSRSVDSRTGKPIMREAYPKEVEDYMKGEGKEKDYMRFRKGEEGKEKDYMKGEGKKKERKAAMGTFMDADENSGVARGAGAAIRGTKFSGVY